MRIVESENYISPEVHHWPPQDWWTVTSPDSLNNSHPGEDRRRLLCPRSIFIIRLL